MSIAALEYILCIVDIFQIEHVLFRYFLVSQNCDRPQWGSCLGRSAMTCMRKAGVMQFA